MNIMKRIFIICFLFGTLFNQVSAQSNLLTAAEVNNTVTKNYLQLIVKTSVKDLRVTSIELNASDNIASKDQVIIMTELLTKLKSAINNKSVITVINEMSFQGYNLVTSTSVNGEIESETIYTFCKNVQQ